MNLTYFDTKEGSPLVEEYFSLSFSKNSVPFQTTILPIATSLLTYIFSGNQKAIANNKVMPLDGLIVSGQFFRSYKFNVESEGYSFGISFHPSTLHKLLKIDISKLSNKHVLLKQVDKDLFDLFNPIFINNYKSPEKLVTELNNLILSLPLYENDITKYIDETIDFIRKKDGMLSVDEILKKVPYSQKTLENHFKKVIGLTPGKYTRLYRFLNLMRKYESHEIQINDLIYMYNYYDHSHFSKDFALFMRESAKSYFKKDYPLLKKVLKK